MNITALRLFCQLKVNIISILWIMYPFWPGVKLTYDSAIDDLIIGITQSQAIAEQSDLQKNLKKRGYDIPQATLSRRLKKLKIAKVGGIYKVIDYNQPNLPLVLNIQLSEFGLIILQTHPGSANILAFYLDLADVSFNMNEPSKSGILGTIAGDDTVLLIVKNKLEQEKVYAMLLEQFPYLKSGCDSHISKLNRVGWALAQQ